MKTSVKGDATANLATTSFCKKEVSEPVCVRGVMKVWHGRSAYCVVRFVMRCCSSKDDTFSVKVILQPIPN